MDNRILIFIIFIAILYFMSHKIESLALGGRRHWHHHYHPFYIDKYHTIRRPYYHHWHNWDRHHRHHRYHYYDRYPHDSRLYKEHFYRYYW